MKALVGLAGAALIALAATSASAAPIVGPNAVPTAAEHSSLILAHGIHSACKRDSRGWHRSRPWGRQKCTPSAALPLAHWIWRCADGHCGYWHKKENRWKDGWKGKHRHGHRPGKHRRH